MNHGDVMGRACYRVCYSASVHHVVTYNTFLGGYQTACEDIRNKITHRVMMKLNDIFHDDHTLCDETRNMIAQRAMVKLNDIFYDDHTLCDVTRDTITHRVMTPSNDIFHDDHTLCEDTRNMISQRVQLMKTQLHTTCATILIRHLSPCA